MSRNGFGSAHEPELSPAPSTPEVQEARGRLEAHLELARAVIRARVQRSWTQESLAKAAGTKQSRISEIESASGNPTLETVHRVISALDLTLRFTSRVHGCHGAFRHVSGSRVEYQRALESALRSTRQVVGMPSVEARYRPAPAATLSKTPDRDTSAPVKGPHLQVA